MIVADLHVHSSYSDGRAGPREILRYAALKGVGVIAITDHDTFKGGLEGYRLSREAAGTGSPGVLVVPGIELRSSGGDILVYCEGEVDLPREIQLLIDKAHESNCVVAPAHPFDTWRHGIGELIYEYKGWDAVEVWNSHAPRGANRKAMEVARLLGKPGLASSDAHVPEHIGSAYTYILLDNASSIVDVLEAIRKGLVKPHPGSLSVKENIERFSWSMEYRVRRLAGSKKQ